MENGVFDARLQWKLKPIPMNPQDQIANQLKASQNSPARSSGERRASRRHGLPEGAASSHLTARGSTTDGIGSSNS